MGDPGPQQAGSSVPLQGWEGPRSLASRSPEVACSPHSLFFFVQDKSLCSEFKVTILPGAQPWPGSSVQGSGPPLCAELMGTWPQLQAGVEVGGPSLSICLKCVADRAVSPGGQRGALPSGWSARPGQGARSGPKVKAPQVSTRQLPLWPPGAGPGPVATVAARGDG